MQYFGSRYRKKFPISAYLSIWWYICTSIMHTFFKLKEAQCFVVTTVKTDVIGLRKTLFLGMILHLKYGIFIMNAISLISSA